MKIAHLILAHQDSYHIARLARKLASFSDVFIHIDVRKEIEEFKNALGNNFRVIFINERLFYEWGGWNSVVADINLINNALKQDKYDRFVFLQGADYPIKTPSQIINFFENNREVEFILGCCCTTSSDYYLRCRCSSRRNIFYDNRNEFAL